MIYIKDTIKIKTKQQKRVRELLKLDFATLENLQNLHYLFWPIFSEKNQNLKNNWSLAPTSEMISVHCSAQQMLCEE